MSKHYSNQQSKRIRAMRKHRPIIIKVHRPKLPTPPKVDPETKKVLAEIAGKVVSSGEIAARTILENKKLLTQIDTKDKIIQDMKREYIELKDSVDEQNRAHALEVHNLWHDNEDLNTQIRVERRTSRVLFVMFLIAMVLNFVTAFAFYWIVNK